MMSNGCDSFASRSPPTKLRRGAGRVFCAARRASCFPPPCGTGIPRHDHIGRGDVAVRRASHDAPPSASANSAPALRPEGPEHDKDRKDVQVITLNIDENPGLIEPFL